MDLAVVIPAFKTAPNILKRCLESVIHQMSSDDRIEIIVVDSSSASIAPELIDYRNKVQFYFPGKRMFAGEARNFGASKTQKEYIAFLDSDCFWNEGWFDTAKKIIQRFPNWLAFNGQVYFENPRADWAYALHLLEFHEFLGSKEWNQRFLHSGNLLIRSSFFQKLGGFKPNWAACEDIGLLERLSSAEIKDQIHFVPQLSVTHTAHLTESAEIFKKIRFMGFWRGFYDRQLPKNFQASTKISFLFLKRIYGFIFGILIIVRSFRLNSILLADVIRQAPRIFKLTHTWAGSFREGLTKFLANGTSEAQTKSNLEELFPT